MIAEIISIGDELASGQRLDTNSQWLSDQLGQLGVRVLYHSTVADELDANLSVFRTALHRSDLVIATGGLGPTADDLTREVLAQLSGRELVLDEPSLEHIRNLFARYKRDMPESNRVQAMFPAGSQILFNPNGTAPGIALAIERPGGGHCQIFALPGVPAEMFEMYTASVVPEVLRMLGRPRLIRHRRIKCFGAGESQVEQMLPDLIRRGRRPTVGITVSDATITLRITADGATEEECDKAIAPIEQTIRGCLGELVFGEEDDELEDEDARLLDEAGKSLAIVETSTGGLLSSWLSRADAKRGRFLSGQTLHSLGSVAEALGNRNSMLDAHPVVSREVTEALAESCRDRSGADFGLALGPFPADRATNPDSPFFYALATPDVTIVKAASLVGHPSIWRSRAAKMALNLVRLTLLAGAKQ